MLGSFLCGGDVLVDAEGIWFVINDDVVGAVEVIEAGVMFVGEEVVELVFVDESVGIDFASA